MQNHRFGGNPNDVKEVIGDLWGCCGTHLSVTSRRRPNLRRVAAELVAPLLLHLQSSGRWLQVTR